MDKPVRYKARIEQWTGGWFCFFEQWDEQGNHEVQDPVGPFLSERSARVAFDEFNKKMALLGAQRVKGSA